MYILIRIELFLGMSYYAEIFGVSTYEFNIT